MQVLDLFFISRIKYAYLVTFYGYQFSTFIILYVY